MRFLRSEYLSAGGNSHSSAAAWSTRSQILAYGADQNVALWRPLETEHSGVFAILRGHGAKVTALRFSSRFSHADGEVLISGDSEGYLRIHRPSSELHLWSNIAQAEAHKGAINSISSLDQSHIFVTGGADANIRIWRTQDDGIHLLSTITTSPKFIPLSLVLGSFAGSKTTDTAFLVAAGTRNDIQVYSLEKLSDIPEVKHCASLVGHEGWVRSLALTLGSDGCYMLASASADKYVRLWKFTEGENASLNATTDAAETGVHQTTLTPKLQTVSCVDSKYTITFEALLLGHEDWVYSASWNPASGKTQLLTASADGSLTIWEPDVGSGIWYSASRLGEISGQKGATTATGSSGGFWNGLWAPNGSAVACLGRTGSWRLWIYDEDSQFWVQQPAVSGHIKSVNDVTWDTDGSYLLSTSSDQTTRLHAEWKRGSKRTWHEFARPQIHGYDLNCLSSTKPFQFASGADEKLLRVFNEPKAIANMLHRLCNIDLPKEDTLPDAAAMPVLGLSNKAEEYPNHSEANGDATESEIESFTASLDALTSPPNEDILSRHTLFPEHEKLYGHGYEISTSAQSNHLNILATACKASSLEHAVIRLYNTTDWREIKPPLSAHTLTVTRLAWSMFPDPYLLSIGRDRQWSIFLQDRATGEWKLKQINPKAHTRMILDCAWSPVGGSCFFATASRDKTIKIWSRSGWFDKDDDELEDFKFELEIKRKSAVTAIDFTCEYEEDYSLLAAGEEDGRISLHLFNKRDPSKVLKSVNLPIETCPSKAVNRLAWRPNWIRTDNGQNGIQLAVASGDGSVRVLRIDIGALIAISEIESEA